MHFINRDCGGHQWVLEPELNGQTSLQELLYSTGVQIKQLRRQPITLDQFADALNKIVEDFKNKLDGFLGGGC